MRPCSLLALSILTCLPLRTGAARADEAGSAGILCQRATAFAELQTGVPNQLLGAISRVETGRYDPAAGGIRAWPWTINAQGVGHFYGSKAEAIAAAHAFQAAGIQSIDVGCLQINLMYHPNGFSSLDQAFDPQTNALFAARFLTALFHQTGSWPHAAAAYHSQTPNLGTDYQRKVLEAWAEPIDRPDPAARHPSGPGIASGQSPLMAGNMVAPVSRPLGGFGHVIRTQPATARVGNMGFPMGSLAAYRARPVAVAPLRLAPARG